MQSLTCFSQESGAHSFLQTHQFLLLLNQPVQESLWWANCWAWTEGKLSCQNSRRQHQINYSCLLYWSISSCITSTHRYDQLNSCLCNQTHYSIASSVTEQHSSKLVLVLCRITCWGELPVHFLNKVHKKHTKIIYPTKQQFGPCS